MELISHVNGAPDQAHHEAVLKLMLPVLSGKHAHGSDQQEGAENIENKMKMRDQRDAKPDHDSAHDQRADNSPN